MASKDGKSQGTAYHYYRYTTGYGAAGLWLPQVI